MTGAAVMAPAPPAPGPDEPVVARARPRRLAVLAGVVVAVGVLLRLRSASPLWLDEAQAVALARLPFSSLRAGLATDGAPPLYYALLHVWTSVFGTSVTAVRAPSVLVSCATLLLVWRLGNRLAGAGPAAAALLASLPFAVRYATEARMYALLMLLVALLATVVQRAWRHAGAWDLAGVAVLSAALALTHYWSLFLLVVLEVALLACRRWRLAAAVVASGVLFLPWLPTFLFQARHTGTPWAVPPGAVDVPGTLFGWAGAALPDGGVPAWTLGVLLVLLLVAAVAGHPRRPAALAFGIGLGTVVVGIAVSDVAGSGFPVRYSSVAVVPVLLAAAVGGRRLPWLLVPAVALGLVVSAPLPFTTTRTQAGRIAAAISPAPGDAVVFCPDQLGPAVVRLLPTGTTTYAYPSLAPAGVVDWVDYAQRQAAADPAAVAAQLDQRVAGRVWVVQHDGYRTFGDQCADLVGDLSAARGAATVVQPADPRSEQPAELLLFPAP